MKHSKRISAVLIVVTACMAVAAIVLGFSAAGRNPVMLSRPQEAEDVAVQVMNAICEGDFETVSQNMQGCPNLGLDREPEDQVGKMLWNRFRKSFRYEIKGQSYALPSGLALDMTVSYLDFDSVFATLRDHTMETLEKFIANADRPEDVYDQNGNYTRKLIDKTLAAAVRTALGQDSREVSEDLTLHMVFEQDRWWVVPDQNLIRVISGGTAD